MDAAAAAFAKVFVTGGKETSSSLTLGMSRIPSRLMSLCIILVQKQKFTYHTVVNTDQVEKWTYYLEDAPTTGSKKAKKPIHVPAKGGVTVPISVDTSTFTSELTNQMKNGYFLEGFVFFKDAKTKTRKIS